MRLALLLCLAPSLALASGSSLVKADSQYFRVQIESVRKIFEGGEGEADWHREWKREHQPLVNRIKKKIEAVIEPLVQTYPLLPYRGDLPVVLDDNQDTDEAEEAIRSKKPFQLRFRYEMASVSVVVAKLPPKDARRALRKAFKKYMPR